MFFGAGKNPDSQLPVSVCNLCNFLFSTDYDLVSKAIGEVIKQSRTKS